MIPVYEPFLDDVERSALLEAFDSSWISSRGEMLDRFRSLLLNLFDNRGGVSLCSSGTSALHLALIGAGVGPGDYVIVPSFTYVATANAVLYVGATPIFLDVQEDSWVIDILSIDKELLLKAKAIIIVDVYGCPALSETDADWLRSFGVSVIQDCAESFGCFLDNRHSGSFADYATLSFFGNKTITTGEGGAVWSRDNNRARYIDRVKSQSVAEGERYFHDSIGFNFRMTNLQAAIGVGQMSKLDDIISAKRALFSAYEQLLSSFGGRFQALPADSVSSYWMVGCLFDENVAFDLSNFLELSGVETRPFFSPVHKFPYLHRYAFGEYPVSEYLSRAGLIFPSSPGLFGSEELLYITETISSFFQS